MGENAAGRFEVVVEEGVPHGGLFELEQTTFYHVVDRLTGQVVLTFAGDVEASLSRDSGLWDEHRFSGVREVSLAADEGAVTVKYHDGREETVPLLT